MENILISACLLGKNCKYDGKNNKIDDWTYNKALQKIIESYRVDEETKKIIRNMKRK